MVDIIIFSKHHLMLYTLQKTTNEIISKNKNNNHIVNIYSSLIDFETEIAMSPPSHIIFDSDGISRVELLSILKIINKKMHLFLYTSVIELSYFFFLDKLREKSQYTLNKRAPITLLNLMLSEFISNIETNNNSLIHNYMKNKNALLTNREEQVIHYIFIGYSNKKIAITLNINDKTVSTHRTNIYKKYHVNNTIDLYNKFNKMIDPFGFSQI